MEGGKGEGKEEKALFLKASWELDWVPQLSFHDCRGDGCIEASLDGKLKAEEGEEE